MVINTGGFKIFNIRLRRRKYYLVFLDKWSLLGGACWSQSRVGQTWKICFINNGGLPWLVAVVSGVTYIYRSGLKALSHDILHNYSLPKQELYI